MGTPEKEIGIFYRLPGNRYITKKADYRAIEPENGFRDIPLGHLEFFKKEVYPKYAPKMPGLIDDYAYYPRGRVLYREKDGKFIVYADRCLTAKEDKETILRLFGLRSALWRRDEQYQCAGCNKELREDAETCEALKRNEYNN
jgi:hypothetical protein